MTKNKDPWSFLKNFTYARIALGRAGNAIPTSEVLDFRLAHSRARDAVWKELDTDQIMSDLGAQNHQTISVKSLCGSKKEFLLYPDRGRTLDEKSVADLQSVVAGRPKPECALIICDGLSATAAHENAPALIGSLTKELNKAGITYSPILVARYGRVALGDAIGAALHAKSVMVIIGERPGLASCDSLSIYFTYRPAVGRTDAERNCISNIHRSGLSPEAAGIMGAFLVTTALRQQLSGVGLKVEYPAIKIRP